MTIEIKIKTKSGTICPMEIEELLEVEGKPYVSPEESTDELRQLREDVIHLHGRVEALTAIVCQSEHKEPEDGSN